jgi:hypothetical protein
LFTSLVSAITGLAVLTGCGGGSSDPYVPATVASPVLVKPTRAELQAEVCGQPPEYFGAVDTSTLRYPAAEPNGVTVIYHRGHGEPENNVAGQAVVLNSWGFNVPVLEMPPKPHDAYAGLAFALCRFVDPVFQMVNQLEAEGQQVYMIGISGGGWTTVLAAALDGRIECSYPVSGGLPYDLRIHDDWGDWEQWHLAEIVPYRDLYRLAEHQLAVQILHDPCCFGGDAMRSVEAGPNWSAVVDETNYQHSVGGWALQVIVVDMLEGISNTEPPRHFVEYQG